MSFIVPKYYQIKQNIKNWIVNGEFNAEEKIPSENQLAEKFGVSRLTVRQAISQLIQEGFLVSRRGEGTFVTNNEALISSYNLEFSGFMDDLFYQISKSSTRTVEVERVRASKRIAEKLELSEKDDVIQIKRLRYMNDQPFAFTTNYIVLDIGLKIKEADLFRKPLLKIMERELGIEFTEAFQTIEASFADQELSTLLNIPPGSPILFVERIMYTDRREPFEFVQSQYRGDRYKYIARLKPMKRKHGSVWVQDDEV